LQTKIITTEVVSDTQQKMDNAESRVGFVSKQTADADLKQLNDLFVEMVAESKASDDPELFDAMQWFKWVSICCQVV